jgi:hypothetical protein
MLYTFYIKQGGELHDLDTTQEIYDGYVTYSSDLTTKRTAHHHEQYHHRLFVKIHCRR